MEAQVGEGEKNDLLDRQGGWPIVAPSFVQTAVREEGKGEAVRGKARATLPSEVQIADLVFTNSWRQGRKLRKDRSCRLQSTVQPPIFTFVRIGRVGWHSAISARRGYHDQEYVVNRLTNLLGSAGNAVRCIASDKNGRWAIWARQTAFREIMISR